MNSKYWPHWRISEIYRDRDSFGSASLLKRTVTPLMELHAVIGSAESGLRNTMKTGDSATMLLIDGKLWMSDSRDEFLDHLDAIHDARGRVLVHGLGLGCFLNCILSKPEVCHVDVVENDARVLGLITPYFQDEIIDERVHFHCADAFTKTWPRNTKWDFVWHDIWRMISISNLEGITKLNRKFQNRCSKQAAWKENDLRRLRRRGW